MRRLRSALLALLLALGFALVVAHPVFAAEEGGEENSPLGTTFRWINFAVVAGFLGWLVASKAPAFFAGRASVIASAIEEAEKIKAEADARRREAEQRLANLGKEIEEIRAAAVRDAAAEAARIRDAAKEEAAKIDRSAHMELEAAERGARMELRVLATKLSITRAEAVLRAEMTPAAEDGMFASFLGDLARRRN